MNPKDLIRSIIIWLVYVLLHVLVMRHLELFDYTFCFFYVGAILFLPPETDRMALLFIGLVTGLIADAFDNTYGMHAAASVLIAYLRPMFVQAQLSSKIDEERSALTLGSLGISLFLTYTIPLVFVHHSVLLFTEINNFSLFWDTVVKILCSVAYTTITILFAQLFQKQ
jgi:hypothetical protein